MKKRKIFLCLVIGSLLVLGALLLSPNEEDTMQALIERAKTKLLELSDTKKLCPAKKLTYERGILCLYYDDGSSYGYTIVNRKSPAGPHDGVPPTIEGMVTVTADKTYQAVFVSVTKTYYLLCLLSYLLDKQGLTGMACWVWDSPLNVPVLQHKTLALIVPLDDLSAPLNALVVTDNEGSQITDVTTFLNEYD